MLPQRRLERMTVRELPGETLLYDGARGKIHCLNRTSALIWKHCDGRTDVAGLAQLVQRQLGLADAEAVVRLALEQLGRRQLLAAAPAAEPLSAEARLTRRAALKQFARAAAAALPVILTLTPRASASIAPTVAGKCPPNTITCGSVCCVFGEKCDNGTGICSPV